MMTPVVVEAIFGIGTTILVLGGVAVVVLAENRTEYWGGLGLATLGPLALRIYCETVVIFFKINDRLEDLLGVAEEMVDQRTEREMPTP